MWPFRTKRETALDQRTAVVLARLEHVVDRFEEAADRLEQSITADEENEYGGRAQQG